MHKYLKTSVLGIIIAIGAYLSPISAHADDSIILPTGGSSIVNVKLKGYVFGFRVMQADYNTIFTDDTYSAQAMLRTSGLGVFLKKFHIWAASTGGFVGQDLRPASHIQQNLNKQHRRVQMQYGEDKVNVEIVPPLGSQGMPPANEEERFSSDDTLSALLNLMMHGYRTADKPCTGSVPVFDSKQHYNLRMEMAGTKKIKERVFRGEAIICHIYYEAISGFDDDDLPSEKEAAAPIVMYLANFEQAKLYIPVKMTYKISGFKAVIKAQEVEIITGTNVRVMPTKLTTMEQLALVTNPYGEN